MPLESATFVNQLDQTRPTATDVKSEGDDVMRLIKSTLKNSFPNVGGAMNASHTELNRLVGVTEDVQPRMSATLSAPNGETLNRLPAAGSRQGGFLTFNASTGQPEVTFSIVPANTCLPLAGGTLTGPTSVQVAAGSTGQLLDLRNNSSFSASNTAKVRFFASNSFGGVEQVASIDASNPNAAANNGGALVFATSAAGTGTTPVERVRIDASGNVGIGTAAPFVPLSVSSAAADLMNLNRAADVSVVGPAALTLGFSALVGTAVTRAAQIVGTLESATAGAISFGVRGSGGVTERMRIDSAGNQINTPSNTPPTLTANGQLNITPTSNTNVRISYRGSDGVTRVSNLTLA